MLVGQYREEGGIYLVEILEDVLDSKENRTVTLKCLEILRPSLRVKPIEPGEVWSSWAGKNAGPYAGWFLLNIKNVKDIKDY